MEDFRRRGEVRCWKGPAVWVMQVGEQEEIVEVREG